MKNAYSQLGLGLALASWRQTATRRMANQPGSTNSQKIPTKVLTKSIASSKVG